MDNYAISRAAPQFTGLEQVESFDREWSSIVEQLKELGVVKDWVEREGALLRASLTWSDSSYWEQFQQFGTSPIDVISERKGAGYIMGALGPETSENTCL